MHRRRAAGLTSARGPIFAAMHAVRLAPRVYMSAIAMVSAQHRRLDSLNAHLSTKGLSSSTAAAKDNDAAAFDMVLQDRSGQTSPASVRHEQWDPRRTALIVCDMWNLHHCLNATRRGAELCPTMERLLTAARNAGSLIIHAPSGTMSTYEGTAARLRAQQAPQSAFTPDGIDEWQYNSAREPRGAGSGPRDAQGPNAEGEGVQDGGYPIDQRDGGEDDDPTEHAAWARALAAKGLPPGSPWTGQTSALTIDEDLDFVSDSGSEIWNVLEHRNIQNVLLMGVSNNHLSFSQ